MDVSTCCLRLRSDSFINCCQFCCLSEVEDSSVIKGKVFANFNENSNMSYIYIFLLGLFTGIFGTSEIPHTELERAFNSNDAAKIIEYTKEKVLITIDGNEGAFNQAQAKLILKDFFSKNPNGTFSFIFKGKPADSGTFSIGTYETKSKSYRITLHFKKSGNDFLAESINIE